jgi:hypothetical protein
MISVTVVKLFYIIKLAIKSEDTPREPDRQSTTSSFVISNHVYCV